MYQICNLADCISLTQSFVSDRTAIMSPPDDRLTTDHISRCLPSLLDVRADDPYKAWRDEVLQVYNFLWYAWLNIIETRERRAKYAAEEEEKAAQRAARLESLKIGEHGPGYHLLGERHRGRILSPVVSSIRDEENTRSPSPRASRGTTPSATGEDNPEAKDSVAEDDTKGPETLNAADNTMTASGPEAEGNNNNKVQAKLSYADKLFAAMLAAREPAPPDTRKSGASGVSLRGRISSLRPTAKGGSHDKARESTRTSSKDGTGVSWRSTERGVPIDLLVHAARLQMGEGADNAEGEEDEDVRDREEGERGGERGTPPGVESSTSATADTVDATGDTPQASESGHVHDRDTILVSTIHSMLGSEAD